jgi:hypothetical protein
VGYDTWMADLGDTIAAKPFNQLVLPGTHESATYSLIEDSAMGPGCESIVYDVKNDSDKIEKIASLLSVVFVGLGPVDLLAIAAAVIAAYVSESGFDSTVQAWSVAQNRDITQQLTDGVRYFDLRIAPLPPSNVPSIVHGHYGAAAATLLTAVSSFLSTRPKEIVILDFNHFYAMTPDLHAGLAQTISGTFGDLLADRTTFNPASTVSELWADGKQVIVLYGGDENAANGFPASEGAATTVDANDFLWYGQQSWYSPDGWNRTIISPYKESADVGEVMEFLNTQLTFYRPANGNDPWPSRFYVVQGIIAPNGAEIIGSVVGMEPDDLIDASAPITEAVDQALLGQWAGNNPNIVFCDAYQNSTIPPYAVAANGGLADALVALWAGGSGGGGALKVGTCPPGSSISSFTISSPSAGSKAFAVNGIGATTFNGALVAAWQPAFFRPLQIIATYTPNMFPPQAVTLVDPATGRQQYAQDAPALAQFNQKLYISWVYSNNLFMMSSLDGVVFADKSEICVPTSGSSVAQPVQSACGPALAAFDGKLWLAWTTNDTDGNVMLASSSDGVEWSEPVAVGGSSVNGPGLGVFTPDGSPEQLYVTWTSEVSQVYVAFTTDGQSFTPTGLTNNGQSELAHASPALGAFDGQLYLIFAPSTSAGLVLRWSSDGSNWPDADRYVQPPPNTMVAAGKPALVGYVSNPVTIETLSPSGANVGQSMLIIGSGLGPGAVGNVLINTTRATLLRQTPTQLAVTVPQGATSGYVSVTILGSGTARSDQPFIVNGQPYIVDLQPPAGPADTDIEIIGYGLSAAKQIVFTSGGNQWSASASQATENSVHCTVPTGIPLTQMTVTVNSGSSIADATSPVPFTVMNPPTLEGFSPTSGPVRDRVGIAGQNLTEAQAVLFGGDVEAEVYDTSGGALWVIVPVGAVTGPIEIVWAGGTVTSSQPFTVTTSSA